MGYTKQELLEQGIDEETINMMFEVMKDANVIIDKYTPEGRMILCAMLLDTCAGEMDVPIAELYDKMCGMAVAVENEYGKMTPEVLKNASDNN